MGSKSVLIIGAGVVGLCSAYYLIKRGHSVTVLDSLDSQRDCCSMGNAGLVVPSHFTPLAAPGMIGTALRMMLRSSSPFYIKPRLNTGLLYWMWRFFLSSNACHVARSAPLLAQLNLTSRELFEKMRTEDSLGFEITNAGLLMACRTHEGLEEEMRTAEAGRQLGITSRPLDAQQVQALNPNCRLNTVGGVHYPSDCHLSPRQFLEALQKRLLEMGVQFAWNQKVERFECSTSTVTRTHTQNASWQVDELLISAGTWSATLAKQLGLRLPIEPGKGYNITLPQAPHLPAVPCILTEARVAVTPMGQNLRLGGTMEMAGLDPSISQSRIRGIIHSSLNYLADYRAEDFEGLPAWRGFRPCSPDGLPYIGRAREWRNVSFATGHAMMGLSLGPISGDLIAQVLSDEKPAIDIGLLNPDRFA